MPRIQVGGPEWAALFDFTRYAFRYEGLQSYDVPEEAGSRAEFAATGQVPAYPAKTGWTGILAAAADRGATVARVHAVRVPHSAYVEWELASYALNVQAGEHVRILPVTGEWPRWLPRRDFWLFDSLRMAWLDYDQAGRITGAQVNRRQLAVAEACRLRRQLLARSIPYAQYTGLDARAAN